MSTDKSHRMSRFRLTLMISLFLGIGVFLRVYQLDRQSLWGDELFSVHSSSIDSWSEFFKVISSDPHPPLFQIILKLWLKIPFQNQEILAKIFSLTVSILNLILVWLLSGHLSIKIRLLFLFLFSVSPGAIYYAQEVRSYSLLLLLSTIFFLLVTKLKNPVIKQKSILISLLVLSILISYIHLFGFIYSGFLILFLFLIHSFSERKISIVFLTIGIIVILAYFPFLIHLKQAGRIETAGWISAPDSILFLGFYNLFFSVSIKHLILTVILPLILFLVLLIRNLVNIKISNWNFQTSTIYLFVALSIIFLTTLFSFYIPITTSRNWIVTLPLIYYFISVEMSSLKYFKFFILILILSVVFSLMSLRKNFYIEFKEDWRGATQVISGKCPGPLVLTDAFPEFFNLYLKWNKVQDIHFDWNYNLETANQTYICLVSRKLGGNNLKVEPKESYRFIEKYEVLGFEIKKFKKVNLF
ncbi:dolichyl-phosphate-mannose--protein mannosyltransferase [Leptospira levettii]|uniref:dolichyl-phosphate-mannose--protein mannosyltransferase n=2 Tax=Leptospira levettii TaxID=2023178 RepID=UPI000F642303|nr:dolichyl-phosphate-mannose--protein mannosyltransferase [Leptospira levettii]